MMKKSVLLISLLSGTALALSDAAVASGIYATHTRTPRPEPVSFADMAHAYKTASVCFLGADNCGEAGFDSGNGDYKINTEQQCKNEGFVRLNCSSLQEIDGACPYNTAYGKSCKCVETLVSCPTPQIGSGESCDGKYISCKCPAGVVEGQYGCEEYYASPCETVCKKAYADNCRNRIEVSHPYGCESYYADCQAKCEVAKSKPNCQIGSIYYSDGSCALPENHDTSKTVLGIVVHVIDGGQHGQIMAPWPIDMNGNKTSSNSTTLYWLTEDVDISSLPNYTSREKAMKDYDSCGNTDKVVAQGNASTYPAAWAARKYAPTSATKGKWCLPAAGIMMNIYKNINTIQTAIKKVGGVEYPYCCTWSSSDRGINVWFSILGGGLDHTTKDDTDLHVYPVLEF